MYAYVSQSMYTSFMCYYVYKHPHTQCTHWHLEKSTEVYFAACRVGAFTQKKKECNTHYLIFDKRMQYI